MSYADLAAAKTAAATLKNTTIPALKTARTGTAKLQQYALGGPEQKLLSTDEIDEAIDACQAAVDAYYALFA